jgi:hypothetical protein
MALNPTAQRSPEPGVSFGCEHGAVCHAGVEPAVGTAPERARSWLLIEHDGPWPANPLEAELPGALGLLAARADQLGLRVQLIRKPGRRPRPSAEPAVLAGRASVFVGWTAGPSPWLRRGDAATAGHLHGQLAGLPDGAVPAFGSPVTAPLYLVCAHGRRDVCCARLGGPLARALGQAHPDHTWETTHVGGHRYAANLVILPHGLYYGPVDAAGAADAIAAYQRGEVSPARYRGRAGESRDDQQARYRQMAESGRYGLADTRQPCLIPAGGA